MPYTRRKGDSWISQLMRPRIVSTTSRASRHGEGPRARTEESRRAPPRTPSLPTRSKDKVSFDGNARSRSSRTPRKSTIVEEQITDRTATAGRNTYAPTSSDASGSHSEGEASTLPREGSAREPIDSIAHTADLNSHERAGYPYHCYSPITWLGPDTNTSGSIYQQTMGFCPEPYADTVCETFTWVQPSNEEPRPRAWAEPSALLTEEEEADLRQHWLRTARSDQRRLRLMDPSVMLQSDKELERSHLKEARAWFEDPNGFRQLVMDAHEEALAEHLEDPEEVQRYFGTPRDHGGS